MPAVCTSKEVTTAISGVSFRKSIKNGIHKMPPPIPTADTTDAMTIPAGNAKAAAVFMGDHPPSKA